MPATSFQGMPDPLEAVAVALNGRFFQSIDPLAEVREEQVDDLRHEAFFAGVHRAQVLERALIDGRTISSEGSLAEEASLAGSLAACCAEAGAGTARVGSAISCVDAAPSWEG